MNGGVTECAKEGYGEAALEVSKGSYGGGRRGDIRSQGKWEKSPFSYFCPSN